MEMEPKQVGVEKDPKDMKIKLKKGTTAQVEGRLSRGTVQVA